MHACTTKQRGASKTTPESNPEADVLSLWGSLIRNKRSWPQCQPRRRDLSGCPPLSQSFRPCPLRSSIVPYSCCPSSGVHWPRLPAHPCSTRPAPVVVLSFSCPLSPLVLLLACSCPVVLLALFSHSLSCFCFLDVFAFILLSSVALLMSSSGLSVVLPVSCC